ncbi:MAG TPA: lipase family protein [Bradyrhizobium sp.]|nr:lipase family protein [Bradyrhizobium sp.]
MTVFAQISPAEFDPDAFEGFKPKADGFLLGNARALIWFSQLAYETHVKGTPTIPIVFPKWGFRAVTPFVLQNNSLMGSFETCGLIGERDDAVVMAFAGTDPGIWQNLTTDFTPLPTAGSDTHEGFRLAAAAAQPEVNKAIALCKQSNKPFFITGHSLGGALAALAALQAARAGAPPKAIYTFGMPRVGGPLFGVNYGDLSKVTYRLVHGIDLVSRVPPSSAGFHHVGHLLQCASGAKFDETRLLPGVTSDDPPFSDELKNVIARGFHNILIGHVLSPPGPGLLGPTFRFLPPDIRDHLQDSYWNALTP